MENILNKKCEQCESPIPDDFVNLLCLDCYVKLEVENEAKKTAVREHMTEETLIFRKKQKNMSRKILVVIGVLPIVLLLGYFLYLFIPWFIRYNSETSRQKQQKIADYNSCILEHANEILTFVKECTASLHVEENAYVVDECKKIVRETLCGSAYKPSPYE